LRNPEGEEDQVTVSCCSSQRIRCREIGARTMYRHNASRVGWSSMRVPLSIENPECCQPRILRATAGLSRSFVAVEAAFQHDGVPMGMPQPELAEGLVARDHGAPQRPSGGLAEEASKDVEEQPAEIGEELPVMTAVQGEKQLLAEVLAEQEGPLLGTGRAEKVALAGERAEPVKAARGAPDAADAQAPVAAEAESRSCSGDEGEAEPAVGGRVKPRPRGGVALLVGILEGGETPVE